MHYVNQTHTELDWAEICIARLVCYQCELNMCIYLQMIMVAVAAVATAAASAAAKKLQKRINSQIHTQWNLRCE